MVDERGRAIDVLADVVPLSISSTWDEAEKRAIVTAMLAYAEQTEQLLEAAVARAETGDGQIALLRAVLDQARPEGR